MISKKMIELFNIFKKETGKYQDLDINDIQFESKEIQDVFDVVRRGASPRPIKEYVIDSSYSGKKYNWLKIGDVTKSNIFLKKTSQYISEDGMKKSVLGKKGDFLVTNSMTVGIPIILDIDTCFHDGFLYLGFNDRNQKEYYNMYLFYYFTSYRQELMLKSKDGIVNNLNTDIIKKANIVLPKPYSEKYTSFKIQQAIVEFLDYQKAQTEKLQEKMSFLEEKASQLGGTILSRVFEMQDPFVVEQFKKYCLHKKLDIQIKDFDFETLELGSVANFVGGSGKYKKDYIDFNQGEYPLMTGSLEKKNYIEAMEDKDIIREESVSYNKDNDAGSRAFYHTSPYILGGHHYGVFIKKEEKSRISTKYLYLTMQNIFLHNKFYQSQKPIANSSLIKKFEIKIPTGSNEFSMKLQKIIVDFIETSTLWQNKIIDLTNSVQTKCDILDRALLNEIFKGFDDD